MVSVPLRHSSKPAANFLRTTAAAYRPSIFTGVSTVYVSVVSVYMYVYMYLAVSQVRL